MSNPARYDGSRPEPPYRTVDDDRSDMMAALDEKDAEIERLTADNAETLRGHHSMMCQLVLARDENARLRAALRRIAGRTEDVVPPFRVMSIDAMAQIAHDALAGGARSDEPSEVTIRRDRSDKR